MIIDDKIEITEKEFKEFLSNRLTILEEQIRTTQEDYNTTHRQYTTFTLELLYFHHHTNKNSRFRFFRQGDRYWFTIV